MYSQRGRGGFSGNSSQQGGRPPSSNAPPRSRRGPVFSEEELKAFAEEREALFARAINEGELFETDFRGWYMR